MQSLQRVKDYYGFDLKLKVQNCEGRIVDASEAEITFQLACIWVKYDIEFKKELVIDVVILMYLGMGITPHLHYLECNLKNDVVKIRHTIKDTKKLNVALSMRHLYKTNIGNVHSKITL